MRRGRLIKQLNAMAAKAGTPDDHHALEEYFVTLAKRETAEANEHVALAQAYRGTRIAQAVGTPRPSGRAVA